MTARRGFTLLELLIVVAIIGILIAILFPVYGAMIDASLEAQCQSNLRQVALMMTEFTMDYDGYFPLLYNTNTQPTDNTPASQWLYTSGIASQADVYGSSTQSPGLLVRNKLIGKMDVLYCPKDQNDGFIRTGANYLGVKPPARPAVNTSYVVNSNIAYDNMPFPKNGSQSWNIYKDDLLHVRRLTDFKPSAFMFIEESGGNPPEWPSSFNQAFMKPDSSNYAITNRHRGGGYIVRMDGGVEWWAVEDFKAEMDKAYALGSSLWWTDSGTRWHAN